VPLVALFSLITVAFGGSALSGEWPIAAAAAALAAWMGSLAYSVLRKTRS
jgi:hypothetical protein